MRPEGVTVIDETVALVTVSAAVADFGPSVAVIVDMPGVRPLARPLPEPMVATAVVEELQATCPVRLRVLPSLNVPTAANCCVVLCAMDWVAGVTARDNRLAAFTVSEVFPLIRPDVAVTVTVPRLRPVARPLTVIEAMLLPEEVQVTVLVMS